MELSSGFGKGLWTCLVHLSLSADNGLKTGEVNFLDEVMQLFTEWILGCNSSFLPGSVVLFPVYTIVQILNMLFTLQDFSKKDVMWKQIDNCQLRRKRIGSVNHSKIFKNFIQQVLINILLCPHGTHNSIISGKKWWLLWTPKLQLCDKCWQK